MRTEFEEYISTGMLGTYHPESAIVRQTEDGGTVTIFRDTTQFGSATIISYAQKVEMFLEIFLTAGNVDKPAVSGYNSNRRAPLRRLAQVCN